MRLFIERVYQLGRSRFDLLPQATQTMLLDNARTARLGHLRNRSVPGGCAGADEVEHLPQSNREVFRRIALMCEKLSLLEDLHDCAICWLDQIHALIGVDVSVFRQLRPPRSGHSSKFYVGR